MYLYLSKTFSTNYQIHVLIIGLSIFHIWNTPYTVDLGVCTYKNTNAG